MSSRQLDEERIFHIARKLSDADVQADYLDQICAGDQALRERVEALLKAHEQAEEFLKSGHAEPAPTVQSTPLTERPGATIGRYRLMEQVGEGGMGVVFVAEQERPVRRKVALKIIKPGMDTKEVIARFEAERQALALMDHPNIAKVLDAGSTESGRPFFVMELVRGIPITDYCDQSRLPIRDRLDLFVEVCKAVQHAHQKGIIHRDLKPANVLVTLHDGQPVPKVIDFGVAKATNQRLTELTIYTRFAQIIGTPMYMSPEQAQLSGLDVDTRSDIYSLGILLYELLTGATPFDKQRFEQAAYDEIRRIVREEEPPKPSTKISTLGDTATTVSAHRATDPRSLCKSLKGDLDVIAMKAIEKDRARRYETATGLAADVMRFLHHEAIEARPPSSAYRLKKAVQRNKVIVAAISVVCFSLVVAFVGLLLGYCQANAEAERNRQLMSKLRQALIDRGLAEALAGDTGLVNQTVDELRSLQASDEWNDLLLGLVALYGGEHKTAVTHLRRAAEQRPDSVKARALLAWAHGVAGEVEDYGGGVLELRRMTAMDEYDRLFREFAYLMTHDDMDVHTLESVVCQRSSWPIAHVMLAYGKGIQALDTGEVGYAREGLDRLRSTQATLPENPFVDSVRLFLLAVLMNCADVTTEDRVALHQESQVVADRLLRRYPDYLFGRITRAQYLEVNGDLAGAAVDWKAVVDLCGGELMEELCCAVLLRLDRTEEAAVLAPGWTNMLLGKSKECLRVCEAVGEKDTLLSQVWTRWLLAVCGENAKANEGWEETFRSPGEKPWWIDWSLRLFTGRATRSELLQEAGQSRYRQAWAHFVIAADYLARGDLDNAQRHYTACLQYKIFTQDIWHWSHANLKFWDQVSNLRAQK